MASTTACNIANGRPAVLGAFSATSSIHASSPFLSCTCCTNLKQLDVVNVANEAYRVQLSHGTGFAGNFVRLRSQARVYRLRNEDGSELGLSRSQFLQHAEERDSRDSTRCSVKFCSFWSSRQCRRGDSCSLAHSDDELHSERKDWQRSRRPLTQVMFQRCATSGADSGGGVGLSRYRFSSPHETSWRPGRNTNAWHKKQGSRVGRDQVDVKTGVQFPRSGRPLRFLRVGDTKPCVAGTDSRVQRYVRVLASQAVTRTFQRRVRSCFQFSSFCTFLGTCDVFVLSRFVSGICDTIRHGRCGAFFHVLSLSVTLLISVLASCSAASPSLQHNIVSCIVSP